KFHPSGKFGLHYQRNVKLSPQMYFNQRLFNQNEMFSRDPFYVFMATSYIERRSLEGQIDISGLKGTVSGQENGSRKINLKDPFDVFKKIKGTPKYFQAARNVLIAKVKQKGPFHIFFTFSCGEMRWSEVFLSLLKRNGYQIHIPKDWNGMDEELLVENMPLWDFVNTEMTQSRHSLFKNYTFLITRMFDERVKSFIK
ncbi:MAG: hypothetical protein ACPH6D_01850, partial [Candidatus Puniceispirillales bacterium]